MKPDEPTQHSEVARRASNPWEVGGGLRDCLRHCVDTAFNEGEVFGCAVECFIIDHNLPPDLYRANSLR
jgi:hypothetical protein